MSPWICPRCGTVNAYWMPQCTCKPPETDNSKIGGWADLSEEEESILEDAGVFPTEWGQKIISSGTSEVRCRCHEKGKFTDVWCPIHDIRIAYTGTPGEALHWVNTSE